MKSSRVGKARGEPAGVVAGTRGPRGPRDAGGLSVPS